MLPEKEDFVKFDNLNKKCNDEKGKIILSHCT